MDIICYKAGKSENPENTILAIENCTKVNMKWLIHIDLQLTKDGEVVLFDKNNTKSITGTELLINETNLDNLQTLNVAYNFEQNGIRPFENKTIKIATLKEVFEKFPITNFVLDLKSSNNDIVYKTIEIIEKYNMVNKVVLTSKYDDIISLFNLEREEWTYAATTVGSRKVLYENMFYIDNIIPKDAEVLMIPKSDKGSLFLREKIVEYCNHKNKNTWTWIFENTKDLSLVSQVEELKKIGVKGVFTGFPKKMNSEIASKTQYLAKQIV